MDATRMKRTAVGFIGGTAILLGLFGGVTGTSAGGSVTLSAPERYDGGGAGAGIVRLPFTQTDIPTEQAGNGHATSRVGPTAEVA